MLYLLTGNAEKCNCFDMQSLTFGGFMTKEKFKVPFGALVYRHYLRKELALDATALPLNLLTEHRVSILGMFFQDAIEQKMKRIANLDYNYSLESICNSALTRDTLLPFQKVCRLTQEMLAQKETLEKNCLYLDHGTPDEQFTQVKHLIGIDAACCSLVNGKSCLDLYQITLMWELNSKKIQDTLIKALKPLSDLKESSVVETFLRKCLQTKEKLGIIVDYTLEEVVDIESSQDDNDTDNEEDEDYQMESCESFFFCVSCTFFLKFIFSC